MLQAPTKKERDLFDPYYLTDHPAPSQFYQESSEIDKIPIVQLNLDAPEKQVQQVPRRIPKTYTVKKDAVLPEGVQVETLINEPAGPLSRVFMDPETKAIQAIDLTIEEDTREYEPLDEPKKHKKKKRLDPSKPKKSKKKAEETELRIE